MKTTFALVTGVVVMFVGLEARAETEGGLPEAVLAADGSYACSRPDKNDDVELVIDTAAEKMRVTIRNNGKLIFALGGSFHYVFDAFHGDPVLRLYIRDLVVEVRGDDVVYNIYSPCSKAG